MSLDSLYAQLHQYQRELEAKQAQRRRYMEKASQCKTLYRQVIADKNAVEGFRKSVKNLRNEKFDNFKGYQQGTVYKGTMLELIETYDTLIDDLDTNADRLNTKRMEWENKAYALDGPIGNLRGLINYLWTQIQNWTN